MNHYHDVPLLRLQYEQCLHINIRLPRLSRQPNLYNYLSTANDSSKEALHAAAS